GRHFELTRLRSLGAHEHAHMAVGAENLKVVERRIHDPDIAVAVVGQTFGSDEIAGPVALLAKAANKLVFGRENLDRAASGVSHRETAVRTYCHANRIIELARLPAALANRLLQLQGIEVGDQDLVKR